MSIKLINATIYGLCIMIIPEGFQQISRQSNPIKFHQFEKTHQIGAQWGQWI